MPRKTTNQNNLEGILNYPSYLQRSGNDAKGQEHTFQLDYYDPLTKKHQIESGVKYILRQNTSLSDISRYDDLQNEWIRDEARNNDLDYDQHIIGAYGGYVLKLKKFSFKTGLRAEATINDGTFKSKTDTSITNKMFNLVPYVTLSQNLKKGQNLKLSYTQRLSRPSIYYLNPYVNDADPLNISFGNPDLDAEVAHTFDFAYGKFDQKYSLNFSANAAFTNNTIQQISSINSTGVRTTTYKNIGKNQRYGSYLYGLLRPDKKTNFSVNLSANYTFLESNDERNLKNEGLNYTVYSNLRYTIWKNGNMSLFGSYNSPRIMLQGKSGKYWFTGLSFSQEMFKKKLTASVTVIDPLRRRMKFENNQEDPTFTREMVYYSYQRMARFNLSWRFGQMKDQIKKAKRSIKNEDLKAGEESSTGGNGTQSN
jgi:outer membrane receptor protein involved in Fe transport